jgi:hypothetical protein
MHETTPAAKLSAHRGAEPRENKPRLLREDLAERRRNTDALLRLREAVERMAARLGDLEAELGRQR